MDANIGTRVAWAFTFTEAATITTIQWWDHQRRWLENHSRLRVCCKARQIGMSTAVPTEALHAAV